MTTIVSLLPREVEAKLEQFLADGKTGSLELHINGGSVQGWKLIESGRVKP